MFGQFIRGSQGTIGYLGSQQIVSSDTLNSLCAKVAVVWDLETLDDQMELLHELAGELAGDLTSK